MSSRIDARLAGLGIVLPKPAAPAANYVPFVVNHNYVFVSGQLPMDAGKVTCVGKLGADVTIEQGQAAARVTAINIIAQVHAACGGNLDRVVRCVRLGGFVNSTPDFTDQPKVINGASDLMVEVFGDKGRHARAAVSTASLPSGSAVEIDAIFEIE